MIERCEVNFYSGLAKMWTYGHDSMIQKDQIKDY